MWDTSACDNRNTNPFRVRLKTRAAHPPPSAVLVPTEISCLDRNPRNLRCFRRQVAPSSTDLFYLLDVFLFRPFLSPFRALYRQFSTQSRQGIHPVLLCVLFSCVSCRVGLLSSSCERHLSSCPVLLPLFCPFSAKISTLIFLLLFVRPSLRRRSDHFRPCRDPHPCLCHQGRLVQPHHLPDTTIAHRNLFLGLH